MSITSRLTFVVVLSILKEQASSVSLLSFLCYSVQSKQPASGSSASFAVCLGLSGGLERVLIMYFVCQRSSETFSNQPNAGSQHEQAMQRALFSTNNNDPSLSFPSSPPLVYCSQILFCRNSLFQLFFFVAF